MTPPIKLPSAARPAQILPKNLEELSGPSWNGNELGEAVNNHVHPQVEAGVRHVSLGLRRLHVRERDRLVALLAEAPSARTGGATG